MKHIEQMRTDNRVTGTRRYFHKTGNAGFVRVSREAYELAEIQARMNGRTECIHCISTKCMHRCYKSLTL